MVYHRRLLAGLFIFSMLSACSGETMPTSNNADQSLQYKTVEWIDLMPARDLEELLNPPDYVDEISEASIDDTPASMLKSSITEPADRYQQALISTDVIPQLDGSNIRIPGYLVPVEFNDEQRATTLFAVPWFGACLHLPPPPPNQIILVHSDKGVHIDDLDTPYWLSGELHTGIEENDMAISAYSMTLQTHEMYSQ